jgi:hypothetical protein
MDRNLFVLTDLVETEGEIRMSSGPATLSIREHTFTTSPNTSAPLMRAKPEFSAARM